jgi:DNA polymerase
MQYLEAMGIDVWVSRHRPVANPQAADNNEDLIENVGWADDCRDVGGRAMPGAIAEQPEAHHDDIAPMGEVAEQSEARPVDHPHYAEPSEHRESPEHLASLHSAQLIDSFDARDEAWSDLRHEVAGCRACVLCETRTQTVFGVGSHQARWMLIGEAPGQNEDLQGEPFVGKAGQLLTEMLRAIGLKREEVYIANILKCRPPLNRDPLAEEVAACHAFLQRQIQLLKPRMIVAVGRIAAQNLLKTEQPLSKLRGRQHRLENIPLVVVHHPAYLLRALTEKAKAWDDLQFALSVYQSLENE